LLDGWLAGWQAKQLIAIAAIEVKKVLISVIDWVQYYAIWVGTYYRQWLHSLKFDTNVLD